MDFSYSKVAGKQPTNSSFTNGLYCGTYFGQKVPDHKQTKIRRIRFLNYFSSTMSYIQLES